MPLTRTTCCSGETRKQLDLHPGELADLIEKDGALSAVSKAQLAFPLAP